MQIYVVFKGVILLGIFFLACTFLLFDKYNVKPKELELKETNYRNDLINSKHNCPNNTQTSMTVIKFFN